MSPQRYLTIVTLIASIASITGCGGDGPVLADVHGRVTFEGEPVPNADVHFIPREPGASPSYDKTDNDGLYILDYTRDKSGAMIGEHDVQISTEKLPASYLEELREMGKEVPPYVQLPAKYGQSGELTADVKDDDNEINFDLTK